MNSELLRLYETYSISPKDRYEISQIFELLSEEKRQNLIQNFDTLFAKISKIQHDIRAEQEILIGDVLSDIKKAVEKAKMKIH